MPRGAAFGAPAARRELLFLPVFFFVLFHVVPCSATALRAGKQRASLPPRVPSAELAIVSPSLVQQRPKIPQPEAEGHYADTSAGTVFAVALMLCLGFAGLLLYERWRWATLERSCEDDSSGSFSEYLSYRFCEWFTTYKLAAPAVVLLALTLMLVVVGAVLYAVLVGGSAADSMFKIFVWTSMSAATEEITLGGRFLGIVITVCGLIILSLLLGMVTEAFTAQMADIKMGFVDVREGGHTVLLGYSSSTSRLLEELSMASESEGGKAFVILAGQPKVEVEAGLQQGTQMGKSKLIVRSGNPSSFHDLRRVAADKAAIILLVEDNAVPMHERHKKVVCTLLALRSKGWPREGKIVVQCTMEMNPDVLRNIYPDKVEVVVVSEIVAKLMVQSHLEHGIASVFETVLGFEGDEIYSKKWPEFVGSTFRDVYFRIPEAVVMGVFTGDGACLLNPGWDYRVNKDDSIIALAEDDNTYGPKAKLYYDYKAIPGPPTPRKCQKMQEIENPSLLIIGWSHTIGSLLLGLASRTRSAQKVQVTVYSERSVLEREAEIQKIKAQSGASLAKMDISHVAVEPNDLTSRRCIESLKHWECNGLFFLAPDSEGGTDETNVTMLVQMQDIGRSHESKYKFDPVVEIREESTKEHLKVLGLTNVVYSSALVAKAMASVAYNPLINAIYSELAVATRNEFDIAPLTEFLQQGENAPSKVSFGQAAYLISKATQTVLLGWTEHKGNGEVEWVLNPKDKKASRPWTDHDRVCVIKHLDTEQQGPIAMPR